jgi:hypothetical protein
MMHGLEKSDSLIVPRKLANKASASLLRSRWREAVGLGGMRLCKARPEHRVGQAVSQAQGGIREAGIWRLCVIHSR